jgi:hypothetical protein
MPNATALPKSRRSALATLGGVAALAVCAPLPSCAPDPVIAALDEHRVLHHWSNERGIDEDETARRAAIVDQKRDELIALAPTTMAGACALLMRIAESEAFFLESDDPMMNVVRNVSTALADIDPFAPPHIPLRVPPAAA